MIRIVNSLNGHYCPPDLRRTTSPILNLDIGFNIRIHISKTDFIETQLLIRVDVLLYDSYEFDG